MKGCSSHWMSKLIQLPPTASDCLSRQIDEALQPHKHGGISKDGTYAWLYHSSYLEVISTQTGQRLAAWCFGVPLKDPTTTICCCTEMVYNGSSKLVISTDSVMGDMLMVFDVAKSKVCKAIQMPYKVTSVEVISSVGSAQAPDHVLSHHLRHFCGILAVGTHCGHLYLIDMNQDEDVTSDEMEPAILAYLNPHSCDVSTQRYKAVEKGNHLCLQLAEDANKRGSYFYKKPDDEVVKSFPADEVFISCLHWIQQTGQLAVGFNFGSFQLWRLSIPVLEYTGRYEDDIGPVSHIAYTEPENDPRNFCYLWVSRGPLPSEHQVDYNSYIILYQLGFNKRSWYESYGHHFEELTSVGSRFEHELGVDPLNRTQSSECGSRLVSCFTLHDARYRLPNKSGQEDSFEEGSCGPDLSLTAFVWEAGYADPKPSSYLTLFDMNRWYHAQMPYNIRPSNSGRDVCPYFVFYNLEEVMNICNPAGLMGIHIPYSSLNKFHSPQIPAPEQHFFPSALAFDACFLAENGMVHCKYLGLQRQLLSDLQKRGPVSIVDPTEIFVRATLTALIPRSVDVTSTLSQLHKRETLLSLVLDYGLSSFLSSCVSQFGSGDFVLRGCTLRFLLEWAWKKVATIKEDIDQLTVALYDWSGVALDRHTLKILHQHHSSLNRLVHLINQLMNQPATQIGLQDLETKYNVTVLINQYLQMVLWFYSAGFLPENSEDETIPVGQYAYPAKVLKEKFRKRQNEVQRLHSEINSSDVLHIDGLVEKQGIQLRNLLEKNGGNGQYPFCNFHTLLNMFLLEGISFSSKLTLTFYVLCDLFSVLPEEDQQQFSDKLEHFAQAFSLGVSVQKFVQGIWLLDHKDFKDALVYFLDPCLCHELEAWQHRVTIKAYLYQGQHQLALRYIRVKKPPLITPEDVKLRLTTLLANGLTSEAFEYQRLCRDQLNADDLLSHLFVGSIQTKTVDQLLQLPFTEDEEHHLVNYLKTNKDLNSQELLLMYYLQRSRFIEAIRLNQKMNQTPMNDLKSSVRERAGTRKSIVDGYYMVLPHVQRKLAFSSDQPVEKRVRTRRKFTRPKPLSTTVNRSESNHTVTRATLLQAVLQKTREIRHETESDQQEQVVVMEEDGEQHQQIGFAESEEPGPFVCTPMTEKLRKRVSEAGEVVFASGNTNRLMTGSLFLGNSSKSGAPTPSASIATPAQSPLKRPYGSTLVTSPLHAQLTGMSGTLQNARRRLTCASDLTLLQTPPVKKRTPPSKCPLLQVATPQTPHSILKVKQNPLKRSPSPQVFAQRTKSELVMPTPPPPRTRLARLAASQAPASPKVSLPASNPGTPKQLRFSMPNTSRGETPTPEKDITQSTPSSSEDEADEVGSEVQVADSLDVSPTPRPPIHDGDDEGEMDIEASPSLKSVRDRSPTPERQSPKLASKTDFSPGSMKTKDFLEIDSEVTFNFTERLSEETEEYRNTEPLEIPSTNLHAKPSLQDQLSSNNYQKSSSENVICLDEDSEIDEEESDVEEHKESVVSGLGVPVDAQKEQVMEIESSSDEEEHQEPIAKVKVPFQQTELSEGETSSQEEHKEFSSEEEYHKKIASLEEEHKDVVESEEEHKETVLTTEEEDKESVSTEEEHKDTVSSEEEHREVENKTNISSDKLVVSSSEHTSKSSFVEKSFTQKKVSVFEQTKETTKSYKKTVTTSEKIMSNVEMTSSEDLDFEFAFSKPLSVTFDADKIIEMEAAEVDHDEYENLHLELEGNFEAAKETLNEDEPDHEMTGLAESEEIVSKEMPKEVVPTNENIIRIKSAGKCTKEQADSSDDQAQSTLSIKVTEVNATAGTSAEASAMADDGVHAEVQKTPKRSPGRPPGRRTPTRRTPSRQDKLEDPESSPSRRRSMRIAAKDIEEAMQEHKTPVKNAEEKFRTPPRPTRLMMPPTPPESSSPASTTSSVDAQDAHPGTSQQHQSATKKQSTPTRRGRKAKTPPRATAAGAMTKARSRSSSPPVVTSTTEDMPCVSTSSTVYIETTEDGVKQTQSDGPLSSDSFMMTMRSGKRVSREPSPQGSEASAFDDVEFTFSKPQEIQTMDEEFEAPAASFVFSPPLTRGRSRRMSITPAATPTISAIDLMPRLPEHDILKEAATKLSQSPAKRPRKTSTRSTLGCTPTDSPINFVPESDPAPTHSRHVRNKGKKDEGPTSMTLRTRGQLSKVIKKRRKPVAW